MKRFSCWLSHLKATTEEVGRTMGVKGGEQWAAGRGGGGGWVGV